MADDSIAIAGSPASSTPTVTLIKTLKVKNPDGTDVEAQAVVVVDEFGDVLQPPLSHATGVQILNMLINIHNILAESTGVSIRLPPLAVAGTDQG